MRLASEPRNLRLPKLAARSKKCETRLCGVLFKVSLSGIRCVNRSMTWQLYNGDVYRHRDDISAICELMDVKRGDLELDMFSSSDLDAFIEFFYVLLNFLNLYLYFYFCVYTVRYL